jgi:hypothetical protein
VQRTGQACGVLAGIGALLAAGIHQGIGGPETAEVLAVAQGQVAAALLMQTEATWIAGTISFVLLGVALIWAGWRRRGWLYSIGGLAALWFGGVAIAFVLVGPRWGYGGIAPQAVLLSILAVLAAFGAWSVRPRA